MGILKNIFFREVAIPESYEQLREVATNNAMLMEEVALLKENGLRDLRLEDYAWTPIQGWGSDNGFDINTIKKEADHARALYAINPLLKKAVSARIGMVHGRDVRIYPANASGYGVAKIDAIVQRNARKIFGSVARARLESELSVAGNVWAMSEGSKPFVIIPIEQISGYVTDLEDPTSVLYWKRQYTVTETNVSTGTQSTLNVTEYIPTPVVTKPLRVIGEVPVRVGATMHHVAANRQEGWVLGLPDLFAAKFWARGHKEMFEAGHDFTMAQGKIAAKVTAGNGPGTQLAATRLAEEPLRDYETGVVNGYGGTAIMNNGLDYQLMGKMGGSVDFTNYDPIAGLIAAGTGVPLNVLLAKSDSEEVSLEQSVIEDMKLRQELWTEFYEDLLDPYKIKVAWPRIKQETVYRVQQAIEIANRTNTLTAEEKRRTALEAFGIDGDAAATPDIMDHPDIQVYLAKKQIDLEYAAKIAAASVVPGTEPGETEPAEIEDRSTTPDQGNDQGVGKLSDGADAHDARDAGEQEHTR